MTVKLAELVDRLTEASTKPVSPALVRVWLGDPPDTETYTDVDAADLVAAWKEGDVHPDK